MMLIYGSFGHQVSVSPITFCFFGRCTPSTMFSWILGVYHLRTQGDLRQHILMLLSHHFWAVNPVRVGGLLLQDQSPWDKLQTA